MNGQHTAFHRLFRRRCCEPGTQRGCRQRRAGERGTAGDQKACIHDGEVSGTKADEGAVTAKIYADTRLVRYNHVARVSMSAACPPEPGCLKPGSRDFPCVAPAVKQQLQRGEPPHQAM